jgi:hypothetical protein
MMKKVALLTSYELEPHFANDIYKQTAIVMQDFFQQHGISLVRVSLSHFSSDCSCFAQYAQFDGGNIVCLDQDYKPDVIMYKTKAGYHYISCILSDFVQIPSSRIMEVWSDKYLMSLFLGDLMPQTYSLSTFFDEYDTVSQVLSNKIVIKPINANGGAGIQFLSQKELLQQKDQYGGLWRLYIVQDFKDLSQWYGDIIVWVHDLRLVFVAWKLSFAALRYPASWDLRCNLGSGWSLSIFPLAEIPSDLLDMSALAQKRLGVSDKDFYSIDFAYSRVEERWYIMEVNSCPTFWFPPEWKKDQESFFMDLCSLFKSL